MEQMEKLYKELTGIDITEKKERWDERDRGYYGEFLVFEKLCKKFPGGKILMNLRIPSTKAGKTTELDAVMLHETGFYVFEVKHHRGKIWGKASDENWVQYFSAKNAHTFQNPVKQNQYHIDSLKTMFPDIPIYSFVVFTSPKCNFMVNTRKAPKNTSICTIKKLTRKVRKYYRKRRVLSAAQVVEYIDKLKPYAPVVVNGELVGGHDQ